MRYFQSIEYRIVIFASIASIGAIFQNVLVVQAGQFMQWFSTEIQVKFNEIEHDDVKYADTVDDDNEEDEDYEDIELDNDQQPWGEEDEADMSEPENIPDENDFQN